MGRMHVEDIIAIESAQAEPDRLSILIVKLILSSRELEAKVYDNNPRTGNYVVVLEGTLDIGEREQEFDGPPLDPVLAAAKGDASLHDSTPETPEEGDPRSRD